MRLLALFVLAVAAAACDPVAGTGNGSPQPPEKALFVNAAEHSAVLTLQAGYPSGAYQFNFNGYQYGTLQLTLPLGWTLQVECVNRGTVDNSCAVVREAGAKNPLDPALATPVLHPGQSASFTFTPTEAGPYRITDLVPARESAGAWMKLTVVGADAPRPVITGTAPS